MAERMRLRRAVYGGPCPDPKGYGCTGLVKTVEEVVGGDPAKLKHPAWLMCPKCKARFERDGRWADWRRLLDQEPLYDDFARPPEPPCPADEIIPW